MLYSICTKDAEKYFVNSLIGGGLLNLQSSAARIAAIIEFPGTEKNRTVIESTV